MSYHFSPSLESAGSAGAGSAGAGRMEDEGALMLESRRDIWKFAGWFVAAANPRSRAAWKSLAIRPKFNSIF